MKVLMPEEIWAALAILLPAMMAGSFMLFQDAKPDTVLVGLGCILHCPFSFTLHMHRALVDDPPMRTTIYKFDASFIHIQALLTGIAWFMKVSWVEAIFHTACIVHIIKSQPLAFPKQKNTIDILCALGVIKSSFGCIYRSQTLWGWAHIFWGIGFAIHNRKLLGAHSAAVFHVLLSIPQYCIMCACQYHALS